MPFPHDHGNGRPSYWLDTTPSTAKPRLEESLRADVVVVGGGIVGITTSYLLARAGKSVVVIDRERLASAETGHTTAHLQQVVDTRLKQLVKRFGEEKTRLAWDSQAEAIRLIETIARDERIRCDLERLDAYLYHPLGPTGTQEVHTSAEELEEEVELARKIGYEAESVSPDDVPFPAEAVVRFPNQGRFHPRKYLLGVVEAAEKLGVQFYEGTECVDIESDRRARVKTRDGHVLEGDWAIQATNVPFTQRGRLDTKLYPYRTYVIGARLKRREFKDALYWDTLDPYHYTRYATSDDALLIVGGEDHKSGTRVDTDGRFDNLEMFLHTATDDFETEFKWSGTVIETEDDLPYIGRMPGQRKNELVATGDSGTGMTNGTIAALILAERILGRGTPWDDLYDPKRVSVGPTVAKDWAREQMRVGVDLVKGLAKASDARKIDELEDGDGIIVRAGMKQWAVSRTKEGLHCVGARCAHMGCTVRWNTSEGSWDCPCHGSRFSPDGEILHGPSPEPLAPPERAQLEDLELEGKLAKAPE